MAKGLSLPVVNSVTDNNSVPRATINNRNTEINRSHTDKKWSRAGAIVNRQLTCSKCGRSIEDNEPIVISRGQKYYKFTGTYGYPAVVYCTDCIPINDIWLRLNHCATCGRSGGARALAECRSDRIPHNPPSGGERRETMCGKCHDCGASLRSVLDGEEWCDTCQAYRRYRSHGWGSGGDDSPCPSILSAKFAVAEMGDQKEIAQDNENGTYTV